MIDIPDKITHSLSKETLGALNHRCGQPLTRDTIRSLNGESSGITGRVCLGSSAPSERAEDRRPAAHTCLEGQTVEEIHQGKALPKLTVPTMRHPLRKGQKVSIDPQDRGLTKLEASFGWNMQDARCDMDVSAFLITGNGKVSDDSWFVFYGQSDSPDRSVHFAKDTSGRNREIISVDFEKLDPTIQKIVFVLTINEAFEKNLNFSMIQDAYIQLFDGSTNQEIVSYYIEEYYPNVTSMTIGELYLHNGKWKFNPVGNGVHHDLAGQCAIYGVEIE